ncbi:hypothetical protein RFH61_14350 [Acinetobacter baumannii]|uniref:hypothetical protein n=1 Tax=Acinetobacter baumannii TaxID=470 RepID=UPI000A32B888|nr:hypothetical protein [Acinetobacter baumannii]MDQ8923106.1 hypothetical protein [Acinetobacter baumannii]MDQ8926518.1 hypothetical protein [Acinetobacter baumannii]MDQ8933444.1 hypothetical protein [Acinetobacter baumannii]OTK66641.1 hypothetical protein B9X93_13020 [Acinetobacter baumannii]
MKKFNYLDQLIANCEEAKNAVPTKTIRLCNLKEKKHIDEFIEIKGIKGGIYIIREIGGNPEKTFKDFSDFKQDQKSKASEGLCCAKLNSPSKVLYVGSCIGLLRTRLNNHLFAASRSTYALRLNEWFDDRKYQIDIEVFEVKKEILQLIEENRAYELQPAFGKRGPNNK